MSVAELLARAAAAPEDVELRLVLADALEEADEAIAAAFVRQELALRFIAPDHVARLDAETELSWLRRALSTGWQARLEPARDELGVPCSCHRDRRRPRFDRLHDERQDTESAPWKALGEEIQEAVRDAREGFAPGEFFSGRQWREIVTLPPGVGELIRVRVLDLEGAYLLRLPPEIGSMRSLERIHLPSSYGLHWLPHEIVRCRRLEQLDLPRTAYGEELPVLKPDRPPPGLPDHRGRERPCSVCDQGFVDRQEFRAFRRRRLGGQDVVLLVNACSAGCLERA